MAQNIQVGPYITVRTQQKKAEVGPTSGPTCRLSHLVTRFRLHSNSDLFLLLGRIIFLRGSLVLGRLLFLRHGNPGSLLRGRLLRGSLLRGLRAPPTPVVLIVFRCWRRGGARALRGGVDAALAVRILRARAVSAVPGPPPPARSSATVARQFSSVV